MAALLRERGGVACEIVVIKTSGDRLADVPLAEVGGKRLFVKEIEDALLAGDVDIAVHSSKDMPALLPAGLTLGADAAARGPARRAGAPAGAPAADPRADALDGARTVARGSAPAACDAWRSCARPIPGARVRPDAREPGHAPAQARPARRNRRAGPGRGRPAAARASRTGSRRSCPSDAACPPRDRASWPSRRAQRRSPVARRACGAIDDAVGHAGARGRAGGSIATGRRMPDADRRVRHAVRGRR